MTTNKMLIKAPVMANGKTPINFPNTKGEFEHLTSESSIARANWLSVCSRGAAEERYEHILKSYDLPIKGDTNAKRQALREFIGLTPPA